MDWLSSAQGPREATGRGRVTCFSSPDFPKASGAVGTAGNWMGQPGPSLMPEWWRPECRTTSNSISGGRDAKAQCPGLIWSPICTPQILNSVPDTLILSHYRRDCTSTGPKRNHGIWGWEELTLSEVCYWFSFKFSYHLTILHETGLSPIPSWGFRGSEIHLLVAGLGLRPAGPTTWDIRSVQHLLSLLGTHLHNSSDTCRGDQLARREHLLHLRGDTRRTL